MRMHETFSADFHQREPTHRFQSWVHDKRRHGARVSPDRCIAPRSRQKDSVEAIPWQDGPGRTFLYEFAIRWV